MSSWDRRPRGRFGGGPFVLGTIAGVLVCAVAFGGYLVANQSNPVAPASSPAQSPIQSAPLMRTASQTTGSGTNEDLSKAAGSEPSPPSFAPIVARVEPAVISVHVIIGGAAETGAAQKGLPFASPGVPGGGSGNVIMGVGSGFFISSDGYAVTNNHVVENAETVQVETADGKSMDAKVVGTDPKTDLAVIKVNGGRFPYLKLSDAQPHVGDWVLAIGSPFGLGETVTAGIVSALGRAISDNPYENYIQIDAPVNRGNSGGPSIGMNGEVIGVNTAIYSPSGGSVGIAFDIPAQTIRDIVEQLKAHGRVTRGWLGVALQPITPDLARALGLKQTSGALIAQVSRNSPASKTGIKPGDVITKVNGEPITKPRDLIQKIGTLQPGAKVTLTLDRKGSERSDVIALAELPARPETVGLGDEQGVGAR